MLENATGSPPLTPRKAQRASHHKIVSQDCVLFWRLESFPSERRGLKESAVNLCLYHPQEICQYAEPYRLWQSFFRDGICLEVLSFLIFSVSPRARRQHMFSSCRPDTAPPVTWHIIELKRITYLSSLAEQMAQITVPEMLIDALTNTRCPTTKWQYH